MYLWFALAIKTKFEMVMIINFFNNKFGQKAKLFKN